MKLPSIVVIAGPAPRRVEGLRSFFTGTSFAPVQSSAKAQSGRSANAATFAPRRPTSSCTVKATTRSNGNRSASRATAMAQPARSSKALPCTVRHADPASGSTYSERKQAWSPRATRRSASAFEAAPMSMTRSFAGATRSVSPFSVRWTGLKAMTPGTRFAPTVTGRAGRTRSSMPPTRANRSMPPSSTCVTMSPTSSMCAAIITRSFEAPVPRRIATRLPRASTRALSALPADLLHEDGADLVLPAGDADRLGELPQQGAHGLPAFGSARGRRRGRGERVLHHQGAGERLVEPHDELGEQPPRALDVAQGNRFHGGVHGAHGDAEQPRGDARSRHLDRPGVGSGVAGRGLDVIRQLHCPCRRHEPVEHARVDVRPEGDGRTGVHLEGLGAGDAGLLAEGDVDGDRGRGLDPEGADARADAARLLLRRRDGVHVPGVAAPGQLLQAQDDGGDRRPVVHGLAGRVRAVQAQHARAKRDHVADPHVALHLVDRQPHVDEQLVEAHGFLALGGRREVRRHAHHHPGELAPAVHGDPLPEEHAGVPPADAGHAEEAFLQPRDDEGDLVHVAGQHEGGTGTVAFPALQGDDVPERVDARLVRELAEALARDPAQLSLVPRGAPGFDELAQQVGSIHGGHDTRGGILGEVVRGAVGTG